MTQISYHEEEAASRTLTTQKLAQNNKHSLKQVSFEREDKRCKQRKFEIGITLKRQEFNNNVIVFEIRRWKRREFCSYWLDY